MIIDGTDCPANYMEIGLHEGCCVLRKDAKEWMCQQQGNETRRTGKKKDSHSSQYCYLISFNKREISKAEFFPCYLEYTLSNQCSNEDNYI